MATGPAAAQPGMPLPARFWLALLVLGLLAVALSQIGNAGRWLWLDELLSASQSMHGPWSAILTTLRFDVHPPLYYVQLSLWMLPAQGDHWLMLNSMLWHAAAVLLLGFGAARLHGPRVGLAAAALLAVSPAALVYADQVRMYVFVLFLLVWAWYAQARWVAGAGGRLGGLWLVLSQVAVTASQTAGLLMLSGVVLYGAASLAAGGLSRARLPLILRWIGLEALVALLSLPSIVIGLMRGVSHLGAPGPAEMLELWAFLSGGGAAPVAVAATLGAATAAVLLLGALRDRSGSSALGVATLLLAPLLIIALLSHLLRPVWIERIFVPFIPFLCLGLARALAGEAAALPRRAAGAVLLALLLAWTAIAVPMQGAREKGDGFRLAAAAVRSMARPGDLVLADGTYTYWCLLWYLAGPQAIRPRQAYVLNPDWARMMERLPGPVARLLDMGEADRRREIDGIAAVMWDRRDPPPEAAGDILLVRGRIYEPVSLPGRRLVERLDIAPLFVERWARAP